MRLVIHFAQLLFNTILVLERNEQEIAPGVCEAPAEYAGNCDGRLELSLLTAKDKELDVHIIAHIAY